VGRPSVAKVEVVQRVAGVGRNPSLVVGRGAGSLGLAEGRGYSFAACINACSNIGGRAFPLRFARLKIPAQAFAERKNLGGSSPISKTRNNEDSTTTLGYSKVLSVQHSVGEPIPEFDQRPEEGTKVPPSSRRQDTGDVFPDNPAGLEFVSQPKKGESEVAPGVGKSLAESCDGEGLARSSSDQKVN
jgi:hypothetical protein